MKEGLDSLFLPLPLNPKQQTSPLPAPVICLHIENPGASSEVVLIESSSIFKKKKKI